MNLHPDEHIAVLLLDDLANIITHRSIFSLD